MTVVETRQSYSFALNAAITSFFTLSFILPCRRASIVLPHRYEDMYRYVSGCAKQGEQTYFVCPKIEGDDEGTVMSVTELYEERAAQRRNGAVRRTQRKPVF